MIGIANNKKINVYCSAKFHMFAAKNARELLRDEDGQQPTNQ